MRERFRKNEKVSKGERAFFQLHGLAMQADETCVDDKREKSLISGKAIVSPGLTELLGLDGNKNQARQVAVAVWSDTSGEIRKDGLELSVGGHEVSVQVRVRRDQFLLQYAVPSSIYEQCSQKAEDLFNFAVELSQEILDDYH